MSQDERRPLEARRAVPPLARIRPLGTGAGAGIRGDLVGTVARSTTP
ncbi:hypothetical protein GXW74_15475 [Roseomonas eburnea]|uniref:Uncharacterized protein n=1 Tax=Neoroseomonas eburnea TaxID=1346889 RepID=A0A9X9XDV8_9PROT|nr:hypothetical protein [Neoroseomonas eburnea]MBR0681894.1 hypothetical protein [Neoroseomonas eburnea]